MFTSIPSQLKIAKMKESIKVLHECAELQLKKSNDYQNPNSTIRQADYYPRGFASILDIIDRKSTRLNSSHRT